MSIRWLYFWFFVSIAGTIAMWVALAGVIAGRFYFLPTSSLRGSNARLTSLLVLVLSLIVLYVAGEVIYHP
jgi:hypothetical protein